MTNPQTVFDQLRELKLHGFHDELHDQLENKESLEMDFLERLSFLVQREYLLRKNKRLQNRLKSAGLRINACLEDIFYKPSRKLDKAQIRLLGECEWVRDRKNILITGPTGAGKTHLACALGHRACLRGFKVKYFRFPKLFEKLELSREKGRLLKFYESIAKADVLILDDWAISNISQSKALILMEIFEDRYMIKSTITTSQFPVNTWYQKIEDSTLAESILDRLVHNGHRIQIEGESMRKNPPKIKETSNAGKLEN